MHIRHRLVALILLVACKGGVPENTYTSVASDGAVLELKPAGVFTYTVPGMAASQGTYTMDGEKIVLTMDGQTHTLLKSQNCVEDERKVFSRMCIGGKEGDAAKPTP